MKHQKKVKRTTKLRVQVLDGYIYVQASLPKRWLIILTTIVCALFTSTPIVQLFDLLSRLLR